MQNILTYSNMKLIFRTTKKLSLPIAENIFIFSAIEEGEAPKFETSCLLYDSIEKRELDYWLTDYDVRGASPNFKEGKRSYLTL